MRWRACRLRTGESPEGVDLSTLQRRCDVEEISCCELSSVKFKRGVAWCRWCFDEQHITCSQQLVQPSLGTKRNCHWNSCSYKPLHFASRWNSSYISTGIHAELEKPVFKHPGVRHLSSLAQETCLIYVLNHTHKRPAKDPEKCHTLLVPINVP